METKNVKPASNGAAEVKTKNGSSLNVVTPSATVKKEEGIAELKRINTVEKILHDLEILNARKKDYEQILETHKKLKAFNPTVTESGITLTITDRNNTFKTTATEPLKMILGNYINIVEHKIREVEADISHLAGKLAA